MTDPDLIRWAAELCGHEVIDIWGDLFVRICDEADVNAQVSINLNSIEPRCLGCKNLMADLLAKFVEATPEPSMMTPDFWSHDIDGGECYATWWHDWDAQRRTVVDAIPQGPLAVIREIHGTGVLS